MANTRVAIGVVVAFDFHNCRVPQAPIWMQGKGLEWLFRLSQDPKRLWRRYILDNGRFVAKLAATSATRSRVLPDQD